MIFCNKSIYIGQLALLIPRYSWGDSVLDYIFISAKHLNNYTPLGIVLDMGETKCAPEVAAIPSPEAVL